MVYKRLSLACDLGPNRRLRGGQTGNRHAVGRAGHVIKPRPFAEADRGRIAAMLAANPELYQRSSRPVSYTHLTLPTNREV